LKKLIISYKLHAAMKNSILGLVLISALASPVLVSTAHAGVAEAIQAGVSPAKAMVIQLAQLIRLNEENRREKIPYRAAKMIEVLLYRSKFIEDAVQAKRDYQFGSQIVYQASTTTLSFREGGTQISVTLKDTALEWRVEDSTPSQGSISFADLNDTKMAELENSIYDQVLRSRGYQTQELRDTSASLDEAQIGQKETKLEINEKWVNQGNLEGSSWEFTPVRLISWPLLKIFYDIPAMISGTVTESVSRSPGHNLGGTWDEARGAGKLTVNAFKDIGLGIIHPTQGRFIDGTLELLDVSLKIGNVALGVIKTGVSIVAYPIYRLFGGKKSQRVALRGKRAVILIVDSGTGTLLGDGIGDTYGEMIVRSKLKSIADYFCVRTNYDSVSMDQCIQNMPSNIQYLDIVSLQHSGGMGEAEEIAKKATRLKGVRPELLLSIGCYDLPSKFVEGENTMGQMKTSWAVHYYLANMLEKRLRGLPADQAANQAFGEGFVNNAIDPVSWGGVILIGAMMEDKLTDGYMGSQPNLITADLIVRETLAQSGKESMSAERKTKLKKFHENVETLLREKKITLKRKTLKLLRASEATLAAQ
jgi:hypothetical protein